MSILTKRILYHGCRNTKNEISELHLDVSQNLRAQFPEIFGIFSKKPIVAAQNFQRSPCVDSDLGMIIPWANFTAISV